MANEEILKKAIELLKKAEDVLSDYWFRPGEDVEDYNNDDVIEVDEEIIEFLKSLEKENDR